ncbi:MAG: glycerol-3-phosphate responsive antiterminator [Bythopirellula sp.]
MMPRNIGPCLAKPVIPVLWEMPQDRSLVAAASSVFLQGGSIAELPKVLAAFDQPQLQKVHVFVHIDLIAGLENSDAGLEYLADLKRIEGVVTIHHNLTRASHRLGLLSIVRLFLSDSRAVDRGLSIVEKSKADAIEIMPALVAAKTAGDFERCRLPRIAGGLCRSEQDLSEALASGVKAVTSTRPGMWRANL